MSARLFSELREKMSPEAKDRAREKTNDMLSRISLENDDIVRALRARLALAEKVVEAARELKRANMGCADAVSPREYERKYYEIPAAMAELLAALSAWETK